MSSGPSQSAQQQQQNKKRPPPLANWPTIKILTPPQGKFSRKTDEWCISYFSQNVNGRIHGKDPECRSICIRRVFPHEVRNILAYKNHQNLGPDGKTQYPLPAEGQPANLPRYLGGKPAKDDAPPPRDALKYWDEGWYFWTGATRWAMYEKTTSMTMDFENRQRWLASHEENKELWHDYQEHLQQTSDKASDPNKWLVPLWPPLPDSSSNSLLISLQPPTLPPIWDRIDKLLTPSYKVLTLLQKSFTSGEQLQFAQRAWDKAFTKEPFVLASRTFSRAYERWKDRGEEDGNKSA